ncbi:GntR family transcriptional regulator [Verrucomicrobiota bacterium sgz303538]
MSLYSQRSYNEIRRRLLIGEFAPGERLEYKKLAQELGVSTTPVREAVSQLASEGMLTLIPRLGAVVPTLGREEITELYGVREALESYAASAAAESCTSSHLEEIRSLVEKMEGITGNFRMSGKAALTGAQLRAFLAADLAFHMAIIEAAGNRRLLKIAADSHAHARIFATDRMPHDQAALEEANLQHRAIYEALARRDSSEARRNVSLHIKRSLERTLAEQRAASGGERWWRPN